MAVGSGGPPPPAARGGGAARAATVAELVEEGEGRTQLRMRVGSLDWMAAVLARLGCRFEIQAPEELRGSVRELAARLEESVA